MAAKKTRKGATPARKPKKRAGRPVKKTKKVRAKPKVKARTKPKVRPATDILDNPMPFRAETLPPPYRPMVDNNPPPPRFPPSPPPEMPFGNSFEVAAQMIAMRPKMSNAVLSTVGVAEPSLPLRTSDPNALHAKMIEQIEALEPKIDSLRKDRQRRGIGDNNPPEPIELAPPLSARELGEIRKAIAVLKKQPPAPSAPSSKARAAVALLIKSARVIGVYLGKQADNFVTEATKEAGKEFGKRIVQSPLWLPIIYQLPALAETAQRWLQSLGPP